MTEKEIKAYLGQKFVFMEETIAALFTGYELSSIGESGNVILYGPPGHAKSQLVKAFMEVFFESQEIYKAQFHMATKVEHLFGIPDMEELKKGRLIYNLEGSFLDFKAAIFEEFLDAPTSLLYMLKDIIMSGEYCAGGKTCYQSKCSFIVAPTNLDPTKWIDDADDLRKESIEALAERFPIQNNVVWPDYSANSYAKMIEVVLKQQSDAFCQMMEYAATNNAFITPRSALKMFKAHQLSGVGALKHFRELNTRPEIFEEFRRIDSLKANMQHVNDWLVKGQKIAKNKNATALELKTAIDQLNKFPCTDMNLVQPVEDLNRELASRKIQLEQQHLAKTLYANN